MIDKIIIKNRIIKKNISFLKLFEVFFLKIIIKNKDKKIKGTLNLWLKQGKIIASMISLKSKKIFFLHWESITSIPINKKNIL